MKRKSLVIAVALMIMASGFVGASSLAYFSDVELAKMDFISGVFDLELIYNGDEYNGEPIPWETPPKWQPGYEETVTINLHMKYPEEGCNAKSAIIHFDTEITDNVLYTEPEMVADPTGSVNDLDSVVMIETATFAGVDILDYLVTEYDENSDGKVSLAELDCYQWDLLSIPCVITAIGTKLVVCTNYPLVFTFQFDPMAGNEYQGDIALVKIIITALQEKWEGAPNIPEDTPTQSKPAEKGLLLLPKTGDPDWLPIYDQAWGELLYVEEYDEGDVSMQLILYDLTPDNWYMLTWQIGDWWATSEMPADAEGIWSGLGRDSDTNTEWIDVAMVKTDGAGNANVMIPTVSGLDFSGDPDWSTVALTDGDYEVAVVLKDIGVSGSGGPDIPTLMAGGTTVLFETDLLKFTVVP